MVLSWILLDGRFIPGRFAGLNIAAIAINCLVYRIVKKEEIDYEESLEVDRDLLGGLIGLVVIVAAGIGHFYASAKFKPTLADRPLYEITADTSRKGWRAASI